VGARTRIGFDVDGRGSLLSWRLPRPEGANFVRCNLTIADVLGVRGYSTQMAAYFDESDLDCVDELLNRIGAGGRLIAIHAAANWQSKTWFPDRWAEVADTLASEQQATVVFVGAANERPYVENILSLVRHSARSLVGATTLSQLAALMTRIDLFIGTDSGPRHVAAGANCPSVILMSAQDRPGRWQFDDPREVVLRTDPICSPCFQHYCSHRSCMSAISQVQVLKAACRVLADNADREVRYQRSGGHVSVGSENP
jgi:ADP-heptose:LPS heptosyltransferase